MVRSIRLLAVLAATGSFGMGMIEPNQAEIDARIQSAANLKMLFMSAAFLAQENNGQFPGKLSEIYLSDKSGGLAVFLSPRTDTKAPAANLAQDDAKAAAWVDANSDFIWRGANLKLDSEMQVLAYENLAKLRDKTGVNVLFVDGHVTFLNLAAAKKAIPDMK